jgi:uncharacterized protein (UPF0261 family)
VGRDDLRQVPARPHPAHDAAGCQVTVLIPDGRVSAIGAPGQPSHEPRADQALFDGLEAALTPAPHRVARGPPFHINDSRCPAALVEAFRGLWAAPSPPH